MTEIKTLVIRFANADKASKRAVPDDIAISASGFIPEIGHGVTISGEKGVVTAKEYDFDERSVTITVSLPGA